MKTPTSQQIADRAYAIWEERGHPQDENASVDCWLSAERELAEAMRESEPGLKTGPAVTNLDRALSSPERTHARDRRRGENQKLDTRAQAVSEHFIVAADRAHLRIYQQESAGEDYDMQIASSLDLASGKQSYTARDTDQAGRFPGSKGTSPGGSIDERLPMQEEQQKRAAAEVGAHVNEFLQQHPGATWDFAAGPVMHRAILDVLDPDVRKRLGATLVKELVNQPLPELRAHFSQTLPSRH
jgi:ATP-dependent exoDNAse (exonuclease V) beta subunit